MTFQQKIEAHVGGLIKINKENKWVERPKALQHRLHGKIGIVQSVNAVLHRAAADEQGGVEASVNMVLFIDESIHVVFLLEEEVEFLEGPHDIS